MRVLSVLTIVLTFSMTPSFLWGDENNTSKTNFPYKIMIDQCIAYKQTMPVLPSPALPIDRHKADKVIDPDPEWFSTTIEHNLLIAQPSQQHTHLRSKKILQEDVILPKQSSYIDESLGFSDAEIKDGLRIHMQTHDDLTVSTTIGNKTRQVAIEKLTRYQLDFDISTFAFSELEIKEKLCTHFVSHNELFIPLVLRNKTDQFIIGDLVYYQLGSDIIAGKVRDLTQRDGQTLLLIAPQ